MRIGLWLLLVSVATGAKAQTVFINEFHYDNSGADVGEFVEVAGPAGTNLTGWAIVPYNGNGGASYTPSGNLSGTIPNQNNGFGAVSVLISGLQNGAPDGLALINASGTVVQFLSYEGAFAATNGPANGMTSTDIGVAQAGTEPANTSSLRLTGSGSIYTNFTWMASSTNSTSGSVNAGQTFVALTPAPSLTANPTSLTGLTYVAGNGPASGPVSVSGANLNVASGNVTAASSSTAFTVSPLTAAFSGSTLAATTFTVQLVSGLSAGPYAATITFEGGGATALMPVSGTVTPANAPPNLSINDVSLTEGNSGTQNMVFTVTLSTTAPVGGVTFDIMTVAGTATATTDYITKSLTGQTIPSGQTSYTFAVTINGDIDSEPNESFSVVVSNVQGANITDGVGLGTITNDDAAPPTLIRSIQGAGHISPLAGQSVSNVSGVVTTLRTNGFWMQDPIPDANDNTSEGIFVFTSSAPTVVVGDAVRVDAIVQELRLNANNLSSTQLTSPTVLVGSSGNALPAPIVISSQVGAGVRLIPTSVISNDYPVGGDVELSTFDPTQDGLDFFETLEGMRVQINAPVTVGFRSTQGELFVVADGGAGATGFNSRKTITISGTGTTNITAAISNSDFNPERIQIDDVVMVGGTTPDEDPGTTLSTIIGVVNYDFQSYEILPSIPPTVVTPANNPKEVSSLVPTTNQLTIASFNVENLAGNEPQAKYDGLAGAIVTNLRSPDILALEEIQDNNGATNDAVVDAATTLNRLISAISAAGGPTYDYRQINPVDDQDGGQPGGNIRVGFLFNPARVTFIDRAGGGATTNTTVSNVGGQPQISASPGRILDTNPGEVDAQAGDDFTTTRKPLVGEFVFNGQTIFAIVNHFSSRGGSGPLTGRFQPPTQGDQGQREEQGKIVNAFVDQLLAVNPNTNVVVLGDFNEFQFFPALQYLIGNLPGETPVLTNLIESLPVQERYTYIFDGNAQALDYILASTAMNSRLDAFDAVHINAEYKVQLSDHDPSVARFTIAPPVLSASLVAGSSTVCSGSPLGLTASVANFGASYSYTLTNGTNSTSATGQTSTSFTTTIIPTVPGAFTLSVLTSGGGTTLAVSGNVSLATGPSITTLINNGPRCSGQALSFTATATGTGSLTYVWSGPGGFSTLTTVGTLSRSSSNTAFSGLYSVTVLDASGCGSVPASTSAVVRGNPVIDLNPNATSVTICAGTPLTYTAIVSNLTGSPTYRWDFSGLSGSFTTISGETVNTFTPAYIGTFRYRVRVTDDGTGCFTDSPNRTVTINERPALTLLASGTITCSNASATLTASGGTSYTLNGQTNTTGVFVVNAAGTYSVIVTGANGCTTSASATVQSNGAVPTASLSVAAIAYCPTASATLVAIGGVSYTLSTGQTNTTGIFIVLPGGQYSVVVSSANGCTASASIVIPVVSLAVIRLSVSGTITCANPSVTLTASGISGSSYTLNTGQTNTSGVFTITQPGVYSVTGTVGFGCTSAASITVLSNTAAPTASLIASGTITCTNASATLTASGGTSYILSNGMTNSTGVFVVNVAGPYSVTALVGNGCMGIASAMVMSNTAIPGLSLNGNSTVCQGQAIMLTATGVGSLRWNTGETTSAISVSATGTYSVTLTGSNGCVASASQLVTVLSCTTSTPPSSTTSSPPSSTTSSPTPTTCGSPTNTIGQSLVVTGVTDISCATGTFRILTTGGNGQPINFAGIIGLSSFDPYNCVRMVDGPDLVRAINDPNSDIQPFNVRGIQVGGSVSNTFAFDFKLACTRTPPSTTTSTPPSSTTSSPTPTGCGSPTNTIGQALVITGVTDVSCTTGSFRILTTGGNSQPINFAGIVGLSSVDPYNCVRKVDGPDLITAINNPNSNIGPFMLRGVQVGGSTSNTFSFDFKAYCTSTTPPSSTTSTPPSSTTACGSPANTIGQTLRVKGVVEINCINGTFQMLTEGGNGQPMSYANIIGLSNSDAGNCVRRIDNPDQLRAINNPNSDIGPFMLRVTQGTTQSAPFSFNFKQACTGVARTATESIGDLAVTVLGNPTLGETVEVVIGNTAGERIDLRVSDAKGQLISQLSTESAGNDVRQRVSLGRSAGLYLIQLSTKTRTKTVKVIRQ